MTICLYNTLSRCKIPFTPITPGEVKMYVCGPTVYDDPHLGHARSAVVFDVITRYFKAKEYQVTYIRNITDMDDKIIHKAKRKNQDFRILGTGYVRRYQEAMDRLNVHPPDVEPMASDFILSMQNLISRLIQKGNAYTVGGNVYFSVESFQNYGNLSGCSVRPVSASENNPDHTEKKHPSDFAIWKKVKPQEPFWPSPWGHGRPGWHIECSAMCHSLLGEAFDIHGGGMDLIFPHHENEIAQSESLSGITPANYWIHNGLIQLRGKKMSKSLGIFLKLNDLLDRYPSGALRLFLLSKRYRHPVEFSHHKIKSASQSLERLVRFFNKTPIPIDNSQRNLADRGDCWNRFCDAMNDDFNFPLALSVVFKGIKAVHRKMMGDGAMLRLAGHGNNIRQITNDLYFICSEILGLSLKELSANISGNTGMTIHRLN